jgi:hypothetical protein
MHRAWSEDFFKMMRRKYPAKYKETTYKEAFYEWANSYQAIWPSYLREPDSEQVKVDDTKMKAAISIYQILEYSFDPDNKARLIQWIADAITNNKLLYSSPLELDFPALLKQLRENAELDRQQREAGLDPEAENKRNIPQVKMARADGATVVQLLEHLNAIPK